jgi:hypothetical protein
MRIRRSIAPALPLLIVAWVAASIVASRASAQGASPPPTTQLPAPVEEQAPQSPYDVEVGVRTLRVNGNEDLYRTQINERSGILLRSFTLLTSEPAGASFVDRLRIDVSELGAAPGGSLRIEANKLDSFRFTLHYRQNNAFSALPAFANPLLGLGIIPGQHIYDRTRNTLKAELELLPRGRVTPFIGLSLDRLHGPGSSTYALGENEFRLSQNLKESAQELHLGTGFSFGSVHGSVTQGWRRLRSSELWTLTSPTGNNSDPILGRPILAGDIRRQDQARVDTPFTNVFASGQIAKRLRLFGNYVRYAADSTGDETESASGSFISLALSRFFSGLTEHASSSAKNTTWHGGGRAELTVHRGVDLFAGYQKEHRDLDGSALLDTIYLQTLTLGGFDPRDIETVLHSHSSIRRDEDVANVGVSARALGPFAVRVEYRDDRQKVNVAPDLLEIVLPGNQGGDFERHIKTFDATTSFMKQGFFLGGAYRHDSANQPVFRTDFRDRDRVRLRAAWRKTSWLHAAVSAEETRQTNDQPGIAMAGKSRQYGGDVEVIPHEGISLHGSASRFKTDHSILFRRPETFVTDTSIYAERGRAIEGGFALRHRSLSFDASAARFTNRGDNPFDIQRLTLRLAFDFPARPKSGLLLEYANDRYREKSASFADYRAGRVGVFLYHHP